MEVRFPITGEVQRRLLYYERTSRVLEFVRSHYRQPIALDQVATVACMERTAFSRFFRQKIGVCFSEFLTALRVEAAMLEIARRNHPLTEVAILAGFGCSATLTRGFERVLGVTPSEYRRKLIRIQTRGGKTRSGNLGRLDPRP